MKRLALILIAIFGMATLVSADDYIQRGDYFYYGGSPQAYYRTLITVPGSYSSCGRYQQAGYSYYRYIAYTPPAAAALAMPAYSPDWRTEVLKYAERRDDRLQYDKVAAALGIYNPQAAVPYSNYQSVVNASTPYGYSYNSIAHVYGDISPSQLYQQAAQLANGTQQATNAAIAGHQSLVAQDGSNRAKVAEIIAKGQAAAQAFKALQGPNSVQTQVNVSGVTAGVPGVPYEAPQKSFMPSTEAAERLQTFQGLVSNKCAACHSGNVKKGGFDISGYLSFSPEQKQAVFQRLITPDAKAMMPRAADGGPGQRLSVAEMQLFLQH